MKGSSIWFKFKFQNSENMKPIAKRVTGTHNVSVCLLPFILLMLTFGQAPNNASKWEMGFNLVG
jgi:hypothetical protein